MADAWFLIMTGVAGGLCLLGGALYHIVRSAVRDGIRESNKPDVPWYTRRW